MLVTLLLLAALLQLPFHNVAELTAEVKAHGGEGAEAVCPNGEPFLVVEYERGPESFLRVLVGKRRFIAVEFVGGDNDKNQVFLGTVDQDGNFTVKETVSVNNAVSRYPRGCDYIAPTQAQENS